MNVLITKLINYVDTVTQQRLRNTTMFSTTFASIANIAQELVELPSRTLTKVVLMHGDDLYDVYPGDFSTQTKKKIQKDLYEIRIQLWKDTETDEPKDEVLDNRFTQVSDAVNRIKGLLLGKRARKNVAYQLTVEHWKEYHIEQAYKRREQRLLEDKQAQDNLSRLENENAELKEEILNLKTTTYMSTIKSYINDIQHTRQIHHLRTKGKLISDYRSQYTRKMPTVATQTDISLTSETGYLGWLKTNREVADGLTKELSPKERLNKTRRKAYWHSYDMMQSSNN